MSRRLVDGIELVSQEPADGAALRPAPVLFVHGNWHGAWCWDGWMAAFAAEGYRCHALSLPGHGGSAPLDAAAFLAVDAAMCVAAVRRIAAEIGEPCILVGHSLGGLLCQAVAAEDGAAALVLVASAAPKGLVPPGGGVPPDRPRIATIATDRRRLFHDADDAVVESVFACLGPGAPGVLNSSGGRLAIDIARVICPVLVVWPEMDGSSVPPGTVLAEAYRADLLRIPGAGHDLMFERAGPRALAAILDWLRPRFAPSSP